MTKKPKVTEMTTGDDSESLKESDDALKPETYTACNWEAHPIEQGGGILQRLFDNTKGNALLMIPRRGGWIGGTHELLYPQYRAYDPYDPYRRNGGALITI